MARLSVLSALLSPALASVFSQFSDGQLTGNSFGIAGLNATYGYVIVGGGTAGAVVAARLTQHTNASVALVEAGSFYELSNGNWSQLPYCRFPSEEVARREHTKITDRRQGPSNGRVRIQTIGSHSLIGGFRPNRKL